MNDNHNQPITATVTPEDIRGRLSLLGYKGDADMSELDYLIDSTAQHIRNVTNLDYIPKGLKYVWIDFIAGEYLAMKKTGGAVPGFDLESAVKSISEGDTKVEFAIGAGDLTSEARLDKLISTLKVNDSDLERYKVLKW